MYNSKNYTYKRDPPPLKKKKTGYIFETFVCGLGDNVSYIYKFIYSEESF